MSLPPGAIPLAMPGRAQHDCLTHSIPIREQTPSHLGVLAQVSIPVDITKEEAERLCSVILALAVDWRQPVPVPVPWPRSAPTLEPEP
jgi:hypothetical protein